MIVELNEYSINIVWNDTFIETASLKLLYFYAYLPTVEYSVIFKY